MLCGTVALAPGLGADRSPGALDEQPVAVREAQAQDSRERGVAYCRQREWNKAITELDEAIRLNPRDALAYGYRGGAYCVRGELDKAISDFTRQIELEIGRASCRERVSRCV